MRRIPDPRKLGKWGYAISLYLYGQFLVYKRTGEKKYLDYIQGWVDDHVSESGVIDREISALDYMLPGNLLLVLYGETKQEKYKKAAESIRLRFDTYPRDRRWWLLACALQATSVMARRNVNVDAVSGPLRSGIRR